jgi:peptidyl-prolyl cis-trans isomerase C
MLYRFVNPLGLGPADGALIERIPSMTFSIARAVALAFLVALAPLALVFAAEESGDNPKDPVVAVVNGVKIRHSEVVEARARLPQQYQSLPMEMLFPALMNNLIDAKLIAADGRKKNLHQEKEFKVQLARIEEQLLERTALMKHIETEVTEAKIKERYDQFAKTYEGKVEVHARHILVDAEDKAKAVIDELKKGADFLELAKTRSTGPSGPNGGDLGYFTEDQMVPAFSKAAFAIEKGKFSENPVQTQFGWHVIKVEDKRSAKPPAIKDVEEQLRDDLSREAGSKYVESLRHGAAISRFNPDGSPVKEEPAPGKGSDSPAGKKR